MTFTGATTKRRPKGSSLASFFMPKPKSPPRFSDYQEDVSPATGLFGASLEDAAQFTTNNGLCVPDAVAKCFAEIISRGLHIEGIFRLSGAASEVHHLERALSSNQPVTDLNLAQYDIHAITGVVKKYLRRLPVPVIPYAYHDTFLQIADLSSSDDEKSQAMAQLVTRLPRVHRDLLYYILLLAASIQEHATVNMMNPEALAVVMAPVATGLELRLTQNVIGSKKTKLPRREDMEDIIQTNAKWTYLWTLMIEHHASILKHHQQVPPQEENREDKEEEEEEIMGLNLSKVSLASSYATAPTRQNNNKAQHQKWSSSLSRFSKITMKEQASSKAGWTQAMAAPRRMLRRLASVSSIRPSVHHWM